MDFKKPICLLLALFLFVSSSGFAFNVHYCGGRVASVSLKPDLSIHETAKDCCGMAIEKSHCCKNKSVHFQKKSENTFAKVFTFDGQNTVFAQNQEPIIFSAIAHFAPAAVPSYYCQANAPPLFKLYSQYLFYDCFNV